MGTCCVTVNTKDLFLYQMKDLWFLFNLCLLEGLADKKIMRKMRVVEIIVILITLVITKVITNVIFIVNRHLRGVPSSM